MIPPEFHDHILRPLACCHMTRGAARTLLVDLQRGAFEFIPNELFDLFQQYPSDTPAQWLKKHPEDQDILLEYLQFLLQEEYAFLCLPSEVDFFPPLDLQWDTPAQISNAILDLDHNSQYDLANVLQQLDDLGCEHIQIRSYCPQTSNFFEILFQQLEATAIHFVEVYLAYEKGKERAFYQNLMKHPRLHHLIVHGAGIGEKVNLETDQLLLFVPDPIDDHTHCGQIHWSFFSYQMSHISESQQHNSCLNRKIGIDSKGNIRNCPSHPGDYGQVDQLTLASVIQQASFQKLWHITKDQVSICKQCEFRDVCTDCRVYLSEPDNLYSKPARCQYDPFEMVWHETQAV